MGPTKNDHDAFHRPQAAVQPEHDAVDDAGFPGGIFDGLAQRIAPVLDNFQPDRNLYSIFYHRMGPSLPFVSPGYACPRVNSAGPA
jgi:hypothetical protein